MRTNLPRISRFHRHLNLRRRRPAKLYLEALETRVLLSAFTNADLNNTWNLAGLEAEGTVIFDGSGLITGGNLLQADGSTDTPQGTYTVNPNGSLVINPGVNFTPGAMNSTKDVVAISNYNDSSSEGLAVAVSPLTASFSDADLNGPWTLEFDGSTPASNGGGTISFGGGGTITNGSVTTGNGTGTITGGNYTVASDGTVVANVFTTDPSSGPGTLTLQGALNASKDFLALNPPDLQTAVTTHDSVMFALVHGSGNHTNADGLGTWAISGLESSGYATLDGAGHITAGYVASIDGTSALTGSYTIAPGGSLAMTITVTLAGQTKTQTFTGAMNASRNAIIMNRNSNNSENQDNLVISIKSGSTINHAPTLTTIAPLSTAVATQPFDIAFSDLLAASNASDADSDPLSFIVTSVAGGTFTLGGNAVTTTPFLFAPSQKLTWTPNDGTGGNITAFSVKATDGIAPSASIIPVVIKTSLPDPVTFDPADMPTMWKFHGGSAEGFVSFNGSNGVTNETLFTDNGSTIHNVGGSYTINPSGILTVTITSTSIGAMNGTKDVIAMSNSDATHSLAILLNSRTDTCSNSDLAGAWTLEFTGDSLGSNGGGTIVFDGFGNVLSGNALTARGSASIIGGDYSVDSNGHVELNVNIREPNGSTSSTTLVGALNASKDFLAFNPPDLQSANANTDSLLIAMVRSQGTFSNADAQGPWTIAGQGVFGTATLDGAGHITAGSITTDTDTLTLGGSYTVAANGKFTLNAVASGPGGSQSVAFTGAINTSRNAVILNRLSNNTDSQDNLLVMISPGNHVPTLTTVRPFTAPMAVDLHPFDITYDDFVAAANAADSDGNTITFAVTPLGFGTFARNSIPVSSPPFPIFPGDTLSWTPPVATSGMVPAFTVRAFDGAKFSSVAVPVLIKTALLPAISIAASKPNASEIKGSTTGMGAFTVSRVNGDLTSPLTVQYTVSGNATLGGDYNALSGCVIIPGNQTFVTIPIIPATDTLAEGTESVTLTLAADPDNNYTVNATKAQATVTIADAASTLSVLANKPNASEINGTSSGIGQFTLMRTGGDLTVQQVVEFTLSGTAEPVTNYNLLTGNGVTFDNGEQKGTVTFAPGKNTALVTINPINDFVADNPALTAILTVVPDDDPSYFITGNKSVATVKIADAASTLSVLANKPNASEINGTSSGIGQFTLMRTGGNLALQQVVEFTLSGTAFPVTNYNLTGNGVFFDTGNMTGTITFAPGKNTAAITINPLNDHVANSAPLTTIINIIADGSPGSYFLNPTGSKNTATIRIADAASTLSVAATKPAASEISGATTGAGIYTVTRTGGDLTIPLTVNFAFTGNATAGTDYTLLTGNTVTFDSGNATGTVSFAPGKNTATVTLKPIDDALVEGTESVIFTLQPDANPSYFIISHSTGKDTATVNIADDTRPIFFTVASPVLTGAHVNTGFTITYNDLLTATGAIDLAGNPITFKITSKLSGTLTKGGLAIVPGTTTIAAIESLLWTPATNAVGTLSAFALIATDNVSTTAAALTIKVTVT